MEISSGEPRPIHPPAPQKAEPTMRFDCCPQCQGEWKAQLNSSKVQTHWLCPICQIHYWYGIDDVLSYSLLAKKNLLRTPDGLYWRFECGRGECFYYTSSIPKTVLPWLPWETDAHKLKLYLTLL